MSKRRVVFAILLGVLLLTACKGTYYARVDINDVGRDDPANIANIAATEAGRSEEPVATFVVDPSDGVAYLIVTTGSSNQLKQHLKIADDEYDRESKRFTLYLTRFMPGMGPGVSTGGNDWQMAIRFRKYDFEKIKVVVDVEGDEDGSERTVYELAVDGEDK